MSKNSILAVILISIVLCSIILPSQTQASTDYKHVTHEEVKLSVLQKESVKVFYTSNSSTQKILAEQCLDIIYGEYEICSEIMNLSIEKLNPCSLVFCDSENDPYVVECSWFAYVDGVQCWPVIGENGIYFKNPLNGNLLYKLLPHEIADTTLRVRNVDATYGGWFIEGVGEYVSVQSSKRFDKLNESFWLDPIKRNLRELSSQKWRIVNLSDRSSFEGYGAPGSKDESVFYAGSLAFVYDLVKKYGDGFISDVVANNCTTYQEIQDVIKQSTGYNIDNSIKNVSVGWMFQKYILLLEDLHVNIPELEQLKKTRGIAVSSDIVGDESSISEILNFVDDCNINMLIVDFGWITWSWNNTHFNDVSTLINESEQRNISTWLMYRARTLEGEYQTLQHQIHKNGEVDGRYLCFTDPICRNWSIAWAHKLLNKYPTVEGMILYNPDFLPDCCYCPKCLSKFKNDTSVEGNTNDFIVGTSQYDKWLSWRASEITSFISEWKNDITSLYPRLKFGLILYSGDETYTTNTQNVTTLGNMVNMVCPFVALDSVTDNNFAGRICNDTKKITNATVIADIKIYGPYNNSNKDIINAMKSVLESNGDGFFIWCYDELNPAKYNLTSIKEMYNYYYVGESTGVSANNFNQVDMQVYIFIVIGIIIVLIVIMGILFSIRNRKVTHLSKLSWKRYKKLIVAFIIAIVVICAVLFIVLQQENDSNKFIGSWQLESGPMYDPQNPMNITFYRDGRYSTNYQALPGTLSWGTYSLENDTIRITDLSGFSYPVDCKYKFSNERTRLNITYAGYTLVFTKIQEAPILTGENILGNSDFENGASGNPLYWFKAMIPNENLTMSWDNEIKYNGNRSVSINNTHIYDESVSNNWQQSIVNVPAGRTVELSGWIKTIDAESVVMCLGCYKDNNVVGFGTTQTTTNIIGTTDWQMYNVSVYVPNETDKITVMLALTGTGQVWFDDVKLIVT